VRLIPFPQSSTVTAAATTTFRRDRAAPAAGWLHSPAFDLNFIITTAALALVAGFLLAAHPWIWQPLLVPFLWLLGYPHVVATFTRFTYDRPGLTQYRFLLFVLPPLLFALCVGITLAIGTWALVALYLYWQWFHFTRQSYGVARFYAHRAGGPIHDPRAVHALIYLLPTAGILYRSYQDPGAYLGSQLKVIPIPYELFALVALIAGTIIVWWLARRAADFWRGELQLAHTLYLLSHIVVFAVAYIVLDDINHGWLTVSVWHSAQYLLFVWMYQRNHFNGALDVRRPVLSQISQPGRGLLFYGAVILASTVTFLLLIALLDLAAVAAVPLTLVVFMTINFHHYTVDGVVWRRRGATKPDPAAAVL